MPSYKPAGGLLWKGVSPKLKVTDSFLMKNSVRILPLTDVFSFIEMQ
jgi:hypothetical protein